MWIQTSIWSNRLKSIWLIVSFPIILILVLWIIFLIAMMWSGESLYFAWELNYNLLYETTYSAWSILMIVLPIVLIWFFISFFFHRQLIFLFSWAKKIERKENPEIYNIVENLCISRWLEIPNIWILEDDSLNAFATWRWKKSRIVFSRWIINKLEKKEIEAVAGHELTHIVNNDTFLMVVVILFVWIIATLWEVIFRIWVRMKWDKDSAKVKLWIILWGIALMIVWYLVFPLIRLAISRKREYLADAWSVELTKDKNAMISALKKISQDPVIESIEKQTVATMCIESPFEAKKKKSRFRNMLSTHPSIEDRIKALENY